MILHKLPIDASISDPALSRIKKMAALCHARIPEMIPSLHLVERCEEATAGLRPTEEPRPGFDAGPVNRLASSNRPLPGLEWEVFAVQRSPARGVFLIGGVEVEIREEEQTALKGKVLDLIHDKLVAVPPE